MLVRILLITFLVAVSGSDVLAASWADALFADRTHDFGTVARGAKVEHDFILVNSQSREIRVRNIRVSCGCVHATMPQETIAAGGQATLHATMSTAGFVGNKSVTIYVEFDRPSRQTATLRVSAHIVEAGVIGPQEVDFGVLTKGTSAEKRLHLDYTGDENWAVTGLDKGSEHLHTEVSEVSRKEGKVRYELTIRLSQDLPAGPFVDQIRIHTNNPINSQVNVAVRAQVPGDVLACPKLLRFGDLPAGKTIQKSIIVKADQPFRIIRAENTRGNFEVRSGGSQKTAQLVVLELTVPADPSTISDHIDFITDLPGNQVVSVDILRE